MLIEHNCRDASETSSEDNHSSLTLSTTKATIPPLPATILPSTTITITTRPKTTAPPPTTTSNTVASTTTTKVYDLFQLS